MSLQALQLAGGDDIALGLYAEEGESEDKLGWQGERWWRHCCPLVSYAPGTLQKPHQGP